MTTHSTITYLSQTVSFSYLTNPNNAMEHIILYYTIIQLLLHISMIKFLSIILVLTSALAQDPIVKCNETALTYLSNFVLGQQYDLNKTFSALRSTIKVPSFSYTPRIGKQYIIENFTLNFYVVSSKEKAQYVGINTLRIHGSVLKLSYNFKWEKKQLGSSVHGTAEGVVLSDPMDFTKVIGIMHGEPFESLQNYKNVTFTNSFPVSKVNPYSQNDSDTLFIMMNTAVSHQSGKDVITKAINEHFAEVLNNTIHSDASELTVAKNLTYSYYDYRGEFKIVYDTPVMFISMNNQGTSMLISQVIMDDPNFQCGPEMPTYPEDPQIYGGKQNMLSNSLLKSTVRYILTKGYFNIKLNQQNWESRAFQFYAGDLYLAIPSLKKVDAQTPITGECSGHNDNSFDFDKKTGSETQYVLSVNYSCSLNMTNITIVKFNIMTSTVINVGIAQKELLFNIDSISGTPEFQQVQGYKIENKQFSKFLISESLRVAKGAPVFGNGYKTLQRQHPKAVIRKNYLFLYDPSYIPHESMI